MFFLLFLLSQEVHVHICSGLCIGTGHRQIEDRNFQEISEVFMGAADNTLSNKIAYRAFLIEFFSISFLVPVDINYVFENSVWLVSLGEENLIPGCHLLVLARVVSDTPLD